MHDTDKLKKNRTLPLAGASSHLGWRVDLPARESGEIAWWQPRAMRPTNQLFPPRVKEATPIIALGTIGSRVIVESFPPLAVHFENCQIVELTRIPSRSEKDEQTAEQSSRCNRRLEGDRCLHRQASGS